MSNTRSTKKKKAGKKALVLVDDDAESEQEGRQFTAKQQAFVRAYTDGPTAGNASQSAGVAGYSGKNLGPIGAQLLKLPKISIAIDGLLSDAISVRLTVKSVKLLEQIIDDKNAPLKLRGNIALEVIKFSGLGDRTRAAKADETGFGGKKLAEMSRAELESVVRTGAAIMHAAARLPGDSAPDTAPKMVDITPKPA